ncbi:HPr kinase/phosphorylase [Ferrigenium kumadai]|uniref:HPr kinase/phosphorylase n=1 Tax=Ferrigenium kumadai TaxID=1682490 RepID=A0AAN1VZZ2_9PROT|nr:HPr(Ser) kinase/phosphatase [Ferrigenium kumadai]BBI98717.1 HPr kinase/phosphorylase [Ferrigenium kumadai]
MSEVNIRQLFEDKQARLELSHVAGADGNDRIITEEAVNASNNGLIGHLNLIHPNWVQVLSQTELDYLRALSAEQLADAFRQIEQSGSTCLIVAGTKDIPSELVAFADRSRIPLFKSPKPSVHLMWLIRHYLAKELAESTTRHGVFLDVLGVGVMITGESAVGKSELGLELITRGNGLVADDIVELHRIAPDTLEGRCPELLRDFLEVRGLGVLNIRTMFGETAVRRKKSLKLIVHLHRPPGGDLSQMERLPLNATFQEILGVNISTVKIPVVAGRNLAVLVEAAARNFVLQQRGIDSMQEFITRHDQMLLED